MAACNNVSGMTMNGNRERSQDLAKATRWRTIEGLTANPIVAANRGGAGANERVGASSPICAEHLPGRPPLALSCSRLTEPTLTTGALRGKRNLTFPQAEPATDDDSFIKSPPNKFFI